MNNISPNELMGSKLQTLEKLIKKRINAVIASTRNMEKNKIIPTLRILESLMEAAIPKKDYENRKSNYEQKCSR